MSSDTEAVIIRRPAEKDHPIEFLTQLFSSFGDMTIPLCKLFAQIQTTEILIALAIAEPATHLHQRVIHTCGPQEVADCQPFERQPARKFVTAHRYHV